MIVKLNYNYIPNYYFTFKLNILYNTVFNLQMYRYIPTIYIIFKILNTKIINSNVYKCL